MQLSVTIIRSLTSKDITYEPYIEEPLNNGRKTGMMGSAYVLESRPKKLVKGGENTRNTPLRPVTRLVKDTEGREDE